VTDLLPIDPCAALLQLEHARLDMVTSGGVKLFRYRASSGEEREMQFTTARISELDALIREYRDACQRQTLGVGSRGVRRCIIAR